MDKKRILLVSRSFYPDNWPRAFRTTELALEFSRQGHDVEVIIPITKERIDFGRKNGLTITDLGQPKWRNIKSSTQNKIRQIFIKVWNRALNWLIDFPNIQYVLLVKNRLRGKKDYDLLISIAHPHSIHWGTAWARTKENKIAKIWVADCGDPFMGQESETFKPPFYFRWLEKWFCRKADFISIPVENAKSAYYKEFHNKLKVIPQGFRIQNQKLHIGPPLYNNTTFGYAGMFIKGKRDPSAFLAYLNSLPQSFMFEFHIYTHHPDIVKPFLSNSNGRIILKPLLKREDLLFELSKMHFLVNFENESKTQTPSKLIDYKIIGLPVLNVSSTEPFQDMLLEFLDGNYDKKLELGDIEKYKIENVCNQFLSTLNETPN